jgi:hypothetical protein
VFCRKSVPFFLASFSPILTESKYVSAPPKDQPIRQPVVMEQSRKTDRDGSTSALGEHL